MRISDWSSDVCSSDLLRHAHVADSNTDHPAAVVVQGLRGGEAGIDLDAQCFGLRRQPRAHRAEVADEVALVVHAQIGRASCRERVWQYVEIPGVAVQYTKKEK